RTLRLPQKGGEVLELNQNRSESTRGLCRHPNDSTHDAAAVRDFSPAYVRFGSGADISRLLSHVRFAPECVAKLSLRPRANRDSVGLRGDSRESIHDGAARGWTRAILLRV